MNRAHDLPLFHRSTLKDIDDSITPYLIEHLTAEELAEVIKVLRLHWDKAQISALHKIRQEGAI